MTTAPLQGEKRKQGSQVRRDVPMGKGACCINMKMSPDSSTTGGGPREEPEVAAWICL